MKERSVLSKILAIAGTVLVWIPILLPVLFSTIAFIHRHLFLFDYLMPAELFPFTFIGGGLLMWVALRTRSRRKLIGWGFGIAAVSLVGGQLLAVVSGLASGETEPVGGWWILVLASLAIYSLALIALGVGGILSMRDLFKRNGG